MAVHHEGNGVFQLVASGEFYFDQMLDRLGRNANAS